MVGNVSFGAATLAFETAKYFQPHNNGFIGIPTVITPNTPPTEITYQVYYLYDYYTVAYIIDNLYTSFNVNPLTYSQTVHISGHAEYVLRNQSNITTRYEMIRWTVKKAIPQFMCSITNYNDPAFLTTPVYTGNVLNFLGYAMLDANTNTTAANASSAGLINGEIQLKELPLWNEYFEHKIIKFKLRPSQARTFKCGKRMLAIDTSEIFGPTIAVTQPSCWTQSFVPGATGILFRQFGEPCTIAGSTTDLAGIAYTQPEALLVVKFNYTAYAWKQQPEQQGHVYIPDKGISGTTNANLRFINNDGATLAVANAT